MAVEQKIGYHEALALLVIVLSGKIFLAFPRNIILFGASAGWMIVLLAGLGALIGFSFLYALLKKYAGKGIFEIAEQILGSWSRPFIGSVVFLFFLMLTSLYLRQFAESFILAILPRTPISVITAFFLIILIYGTMLGIEALARVAWALGPYLLIALLIILCFAIPQANFGFLTPLLGKGPASILSGSALEIFIFAEIFLLGLLAPLIREKEKIFRIGFLGLLSAICINTLIEIVVTTVFNYVAAARLVFPILQLTRLIAFGEFFQRVEAVFVFVWFFWAAIQLGGLFYGTTVSFAEAFKIKNYRPLTIPLAVLVFTISLIPTSMTQAVDINSPVQGWFSFSLYYSLIAFGIPFLLWVTSTVKGWFGGNR